MGGGITGLATAYYLRKKALEGISGFEVVVLEADARTGGKVYTESLDGFLVEAGPDSFLTSKPEAVELCRELGLSSSLIPQKEPRRAYVKRRGQLVAIPNGMRLVHPGQPWSFIRSPILSLPGRLRALAYPLARKGHGGDESVGAFVRRRYGREMLKVLGEPLLAGIHLADPWRLSLMATFPGLVQPISQLRQERILPSAIAQLQGSSFASLQGGLQQLVDALKVCLDGCVQVNSRVTSIVPSGRRYRVHFRNNEQKPLDAAAVVVTTPAAAAVDLLKTSNSKLSELLGKTEASSSAIVTLGYRESPLDLPLEGSGFLVPYDGTSKLLACTWSSSKWSGRARGDGVLLRGFMGGWRNPEVINLCDGDLIEVLQNELSVIWGNSFARSKEPTVARVYRWPEGTPLYQVGHAEWLSAVQSACAASPGFWLAGAAYDGTGIPDCIRQARDTAGAVTSYLTDRCV